jgi:voltage-gated potassium channel
MTVITLTTVGFGEVVPLNEMGRLFTIALIMLGAGFVAYNIGYFTQLLLDGDLLQLYRRRRVKTRLDRLEDHYIVCGCGQMGQIIVRELLKHSAPVVVIESDEMVLQRLREKEILHFDGDATEEESLIAAGIQKARGLVSVVNKDTDNVFIVLTARDLNKNLFICARSGTPGTEKKLLKAGADRVVSPYATGARSIAQSILRPTVSDFMELAMSGSGMELGMEELFLPEGTGLIGKDLMHLGIHGDFNLIIVAIKRSDGKMIYNPSPRVVFAAGDTLVAIGPRENLDRFASSFCSITNRACKSSHGSVL